MSITSHTYRDAETERGEKVRRTCLCSQCVSVEVHEAGGGPVGGMLNKTRCILWDGRLMSLNGRRVIKDSWMVCCCREREDKKCVRLFLFRSAL